FDTLYAEGQRRYVESLSAYARQFLGLMDKPDVDQIEGLSPAISIDQKTAPHNPRSTVGTVTEIYDYLRLLYARIGIPHCPDCGDKIKRYTVDEIVSQSYKDFLNKDVLILSPLIKDKKGEHKKIIANVAQAGFARVRFDSDVITLDEAEDITINKQKTHTIEVVIDRLNLSNDKEDKARFTEGVEKALELSDGLATIASSSSEKKNTKQGSEKTYSTAFGCPKCGISLPELEPRNFSFNSPHGACPDCSGLGTKLEIDPKLIINQNLTIAQGAIRPWSHNTTTGQTWLMRILGTVANKNGFDLNARVKDLDKKQMDIILYGTGEKNYQVDYESDKFSGELSTEFEGVIPNLERRFQQTESDYIRREIEQYMRVFTCPTCKGQRLKKEMLAVKVDEHSIHDVTTKTINEAKIFFNNLNKAKSLNAREKKIASQILKEISTRLDFLLNVGLSYLTLNRAANTLSGGEAQRIRLANQIGTSLVGVIYILDEPSIGLHQRDNKRLIKTIKKLRDLGNTVIVVEHDEETMMS
ncbi:excinuclease ABC subunit UvrA, partial [Candidatus Parcubacteria bacterium]|nr:excinuclease ABC subunit UvrA [Candidatus Parcubacteria bacterium]